MPVGVVDVGSNTVRLEVARGTRTLFSERTMLGLGESVERFGRIPEPKLAETAECVGRYVAEAQRHGAARVEVLVTSPGRQAANGEELLDRITAAAKVPVRLLTPEDEGRLAFVGAVERAGAPGKRVVAVCDVGGGSAQIAVGTKRDGPSWIRSIDIGSMRLTARCFALDPPGTAAMKAARGVVDRMLTGLEPPAAEAAFAVGGSARALRALVGPTLDGDELAEACGILATTPAREIVERHGADPGRVHTLPAGAVILSAIGDRLGLPLEVVRGGVREGAVLDLEGRIRAAA